MPSLSPPTPSLSASLYSTTSCSWSAILLLCSITAAQAQSTTGGATAGADPMVIDLGTLLVIDSPLADAAYLDEESGQHSRIERHRFADRQTTIERVIESESGLQVRRSGGLGSFSEVSLRGAASDQVTLYLDGLPLNSAAEGTVDLGRLGLGALEAIEVYRGVTPIQLPQAGIGGGVNLRSLGHTPRSEVSVGAGSFATGHLSLLHTTERGEWEGLFYGELAASENDYTFTNDRGTQFNSEDDREERRHNAEVERRSALARVGREFSGGRRFDLLLSLFDQEQGLPSWNNREEIGTSLKSEDTTLQLRLRDDEIAANRLLLSGRLFFRQSREHYDDRQGEQGLGRQDNRYTTRRFGLDGYSEYQGDSARYSVSGALTREHYRSENRLSPSADQSIGRDRIDLAGQLSLYGLQDRLRVNAALRQLYFQDRDTPQEDHATKWSPQLGMRYEITSDLILSSNIGRYYRLPGLFERYGDRGFLVGNEALRPERGVNFDVGVSLESVPPKWLERFRLRAAYFHNRLDDAIVRVFDARGVGRSENVGEAEIEGFELASTVEAPGRWRTTLNATWQTSRDNSVVRAFNGKQLPGRFGFSAFLRSEKGVGEWNLFYEYRHDGDFYFDRANLLPGTTRREHNIGADLEQGRWRLTFEARNLSDQNFQSFNGFPTPGRSFHAQATYRFR